MGWVAVTTVQSKHPSGYVAHRNFVVVIQTWNPNPPVPNRSRVKRTARCTRRRPARVQHSVTASVPAGPSLFPDVDALEALAPQGPALRPVREETAQAPATMQKASSTHQDEALPRPRRGTPVGRGSSG